MVRFMRLQHCVYNRFNLLRVGTTTSVGAVLFAIVVGPASAQQAPPELGEETKGAPAVVESSTESATQNPDEQEASADGDGVDEPASGVDNLLGTAKITESKRENGQVYRIELEHSSGAKQYIEETDSDGKIESTSNDIEETPNLPKWKIGSW